MKTVICVIIILIMYTVLWFPGEGYQPQIEDAGYIDVVMGTYSFFGCGKDEVGYLFEGTRNGKRVEGAICRSSFFWGSYQVRTL